MYCTCTAHVLQEEDTSSADPTKFVAKKSKAAAKKGVGNTQVRRRRRRSLWAALLRLLSAAPSKCSKCGVLAARGRAPLLSCTTTVRILCLPHMIVVGCLPAWLPACSGTF